MSQSSQSAKPKYLQLGLADPQSDKDQSSSSKEHSYQEYSFKISSDKQSSKRTPKECSCSGKSNQSSYTSGVTSGVKRPHAKLAESSQSLDITYVKQETISKSKAADGESVGSLQKKRFLKQV